MQIFNQASVIFSGHGLGDTEQRLSDLERELAFPIPSDYRTFLQLTGDIRTFEPQDFELNEDFQLSFLAKYFADRPVQVYQLDCFYTLAPQLHRMTLSEIAEVSRRFLPPSLLPVARTLGGLQIYLSLGTENNGFVLFGSEEVALRQGRGEPILLGDFVVVAESFASFIDSLAWRK